MTLCLRFFALVLIVMPTSAFGEWRILSGYETGTERPSESRRFRLQGGSLGLSWSSTHWTVGGFTRFVRLTPQSTSTEAVPTNQVFASIVSGYRLHWLSLVGGVGLKYQTDSEPVWKPALGALIGPRDFIWLEAGYLDGYAAIPSHFRVGMGGRLKTVRYFGGWSQTESNRGVTAHLDLPVEGPVYFAIAAIINPEKASRYMVLASSLIIRLDTYGPHDSHTISHW